MQWTIKKAWRVDLFGVCAVLVAGVVILSLEILQRMKNSCLAGLAT
jgi:hypothetical protein